MPDSETIQIADFLCEMAELQGFSIWEQPDAVYAALQRDGRVGERMARLIQMTLSQGALAHSRSMSERALTAWLHESCALEDKAAQALAAIYKAVYTEERQQHWSERRDAYLRAYEGATWSYTCSLSGHWPTEAQLKNHKGSIFGIDYRDADAWSCQLTITGSWRVADRAVFRHALERALADAPFLTDRRIHRLLQASLQNRLQRDLEHILTMDETEPDADMLEEELEGQYSAEEFCHTCGLHLLSYACHAETSY